MITTIFQFFGNFFIPNPLLALIPALILGLLYFKSKNNFTLVTAILWIVYAVYEELHLLRIVCSGECNIRIDLLLIYPVMIVITAIAIILAVKSLMRR